LDLKLMKQIVKESITVYNTQRPHYSNYMLTPNEMHEQNKIKMRTYKTKNSNKPELITV
jgi:putative transposase